MKKNLRSLLSCLYLIQMVLIPVYADNIIEPVTPNILPEAQALLEVLYQISGHYTLTGQHNYPNTRSRNTEFAADYIGKKPVIWSSDWGHAKEGDSDSYLARPDIVEEAIKQHQSGSIITICWHATPPTADEPVTFRPLPDASPDSLSSVQGHLLDRQFKDILTPGTELYNRWCKQVDSVAVYLKKLQDAHVPILWRPYHEMNGNWFWWGGRVGEYSTKALYKQLFDRLVNYHKLNNLIWVWSVDRPTRPEMKFSNFYPGNEYFDVLALDVYGSDFKQAYYDSLIALSDGKPLVLGEVGNPPTLEILDNQPGWTFYVTWAGMVRNTLRKQYDILVNDPRILFLEDIAYWNIISSYRETCNLPQLPVTDNKPVDFSGLWVLCEEKSELGNYGASNLPYKLEIVQDKDELKIQLTTILEYADNRITMDTLKLDGSVHHSEFWNSPRITTAHMSEKKDTLFIDSKVIFSRGDRTFEMVINEVWTLKERGKVLSINEYSNSFWGERNITMIFEKRLL